MKDAYVEGLDEYYLFHPSPQKLLSSTSFLLNAIARLRRHNLKWQFKNSAHHYTIVFLNPLYADKNKQETIGQLLIGITPRGRKHVLGCFPTKAPPQSYLIGVFQDLKKVGGVREKLIYLALLQKLTYLQPFAVLFLLLNASLQKT